MTSRVSQMEHELGMELPCSDAACVWCQPQNIDKARRIKGRPLIYPRDLEGQKS